MTLLGAVIWTREIDRSPWSPALYCTAVHTGRLVGRHDDRQIIVGRHGGRLIGPIKFLLVPFVGRQIITYHVTCDMGQKESCIRNSRPPITIQFL